MKYSRLAPCPYPFGAMVFCRNMQHRLSFWCWRSRCGDSRASQRPHRGPPGFHDRFRSPEFWLVSRPQLLEPRHSLRLASLTVLLFLCGADDYEASIRSRNSAAHEDDIVIGSDLDNAQILHRHAVIPQVTRHPHILPNSARRRPVPNRTVSPMHFRAVSCRLARKPVFLYDALESLALRSADHVNKLTGLKLAHAQIQATVERCSFGQSKFPHEFLWLRIRLLEMAKQWFRHPRFFLRIKTYLNGGVSVALGILHLQYRIPFSLDHRYRCGFAVGVVNAR